MMQLLKATPLQEIFCARPAKSLGIGIANVINILSPDAIILTGGLLGAWNIYIEAAIKEASKRALRELTEMFRFSLPFWEMMPGL